MAPGVSIIFQMLFLSISRLYKSVILYFIFQNFIRTITRQDCYDYVVQILNQSENVYRSYKIFIANIYRKLLCPSRMCHVKDFEISFAL